MKNVRSLLFLVAAVFLFSGLTTTAMAQKGDLDDPLSLAAIQSDTFTLSDEFSVELLEWDTTASAIHVGANKTGYRVMTFHILNESTTVDTLESISFKSFNDKDFSTSRIALYAEGNASPLWSLTNPGAFSENTTVTASSLNYEIDTAAAEDSVVFYFTFDSDSANVDTSYNDLYVGLKITGGGITMTNAGQSPTNLTDTLMYDNAALGYGGGGRIVQFDTKPPDLDIQFDFAGDLDDCGGNGIINLGDSIEIFAWDTVGAFEIDTAWVYASIFGGGSAAVKFADSIHVVGADSALQFDWVIPDSAFTGADEVSAGFYYLVVGAQDVAGNVVTDSILLPQAIDTELPTFDGDSVWVNLYYDANTDGIAAVGDTVTINAYMTGNPIGEIDSVVADMSNWGYGAAIALEDQSGDRKFIKKLELTAGALDLAADSVDSRFWVTAWDNACNSVTDSNIAHFAIDNEVPAAPTITYVRQYDNDANNIINLGDSIKVTVDAATTDDLATTCEVSVDLLTSGLGGIQVQCIEDTTAGGVYTYTHLVVDGGIYAVDVGANTHNVDVTLTDDAGNEATFTSANILYPVDTDPPSAVSGLTATQGACAIDLAWSAVSADDSLYIVFWDGGDGWTAADTSRDANGNLVFADTLGSTTATSWTTDGTVTLTHGTTYQFVVRVIDDANNREYNFNRASAIADCEAPVACITFPASGGAYGTGNNIDLIAESDNLDINSVALYVRDADLGSGNPGAWQSFGGMTQSGGGGVFTFTIDSTKMRDLGGFDCVDDSYEAITVATDDVGNAQSIAEAIDSCTTVWAFDWFCEQLPIELIAVNDTVSAQTSCGFNVTRTDSNKVEVNVTNATANDSFTVDVWVIRNVTDSTRVWYEEKITTMPYTFYLDATDFPKGTQVMRVKITRNDGNTNTIAANLCVPDEDAPMATITVPTDGEWVRRSCNFLSNINVWARINYSSYDFTNTTKVEFYAAQYTEGWSWPATPFDVVTSMTPGDSTWRATWNNCTYSHGDTVAIAAIFYDDFNNTYETPFVKVYIDTVAPDISLTVTGAQTVCDTETLNGTVDLVATVNTTYEDIDSIVFFHALADSPDIFHFYDRTGKGAPASGDGIYKLAGVNTATLLEGRYYRFRAIAYDIAGNVMWDYDEDQLFDDNTFDEVNKASDALYMIDNTPVQGAFGHAVVSDGETVVNEFPTPSTILSGAGRVYMAQGNSLTLHTWPVPMGDTCCFEKVVYKWDGTSVAVSYDPMPSEVSFDPYAMGLVDATGAYDSGVVSLEFYDCFGQASYDTILVYVLDIAPNQACIMTPYENQCVAGDVSLTAVAVNGFALDKVTYQYRAQGGETWTTIDYSTSAMGNFPVTWYTLNAGIPDGVYELRAVATDDAGNEDANPKITTVTVANGTLTPTISMPDDMAYVTDDEVIQATVDGGTAELVTFQYKAKTAGSWTTISTDDFSPWQTEWDNNGLSDGWYHLRVGADNCADVTGWSDMITVFLDNTNPRAVLTEIAGQDVENNNDPYLNLTGMSTVDVTASFFDDQETVGNSGISKVAFYLTDSTTSQVVRVLFIDPAEAGSHTAHFDLSGLDEDVTYVFTARAFDAVGNWTDSDPVYGRIFDETAPIVALAGYFNGTLYAYDWSGDASSVLFERWDATNEEWIGIGIGEPVSGVPDLWMAGFVPTEGEGYTLRVISGDNNGNYDDDNVLTAEFNYNSSTDYNFGTTAITLSLKKNHENDNLSGILRTMSPNGQPVVIGVYSDGDAQDISSDMNQQNENLYYGSWSAGDLGGNGKGVIFSSHPNADFTEIEIVSAGFVVHEVLEDFGTNGYVQALDSIARVDIPAGAVSGNDMNVVILESWIPEAGIDQDHFSVLPNDDGNGWYVGCNYDAIDSRTKTVDTDNISLSDGCCFNDNKYATIRITYDSEDTTPPESLAVAWWDPDDNEWNFSGIYYPAYVEGFNTESNYVEFAAECLHGLYAVVSYRDINTGVTDIQLMGEMFCGYFPTLPTFKLKVTDNFSGIHTGTWHIKVDDMYVARHGSVSDHFTLDFDEVTDMLTVYWYGDDGPVYGTNGDDDYGYFDPLACGAHTLTVGVKNNQGSYTEETFDIMVDCDAPTVVFENGYVGKNPTIRFWVTDDMSGVDTSQLHVDVVAIQTSDTNVFNPNQYEQLFFLQTFFPEQISIGEEGLVELTTTYELEDERAIAVIIYDGTRNQDYNYADPVGADDWDEYYEDDHGVFDCVGNGTTPVVQILAIDVEPPVITVVGEDPNDQQLSLTGGCHDLRVVDDGQGFDVTDLVIYEDGTPITRVAPGEVTEGTYSFNETTGIIHYCVTPGTGKVEITVTDNAGNTVIRTFGLGDPTNIVDATLNVNPWDPRVDGLLTIDYGFTGQATVKIYDFGGDLVRTMSSSSGTVAWNGTTEDGTTVAAGVYFGHIMVETTAGNYSTTVKIAVIER